MSSKDIKLITFGVLIGLLIPACATLYFALAFASLH